MPSAAQRMPRPTIIATMLRADAPSAWRMPISRCWLATWYASTANTPTAASSSAAAAKPAITAAQWRWPPIASRSTVDIVATSVGTMPGSSRCSVACSGRASVSGSPAARSVTYIASPPQPCSTGPNTATPGWSSASYFTSPTTPTTVSLRDVSPPSCSSLPSADSFGKCRFAQLEVTTSTGGVSGVSRASNTRPSSSGTPSAAK